MVERMALVGKIMPHDREGMEQHLRMVSQGRAHCETWTFPVGRAKREQLLRQIAEPGGRGLHLWVALSGEIKWKFRISHALFFDDCVLARDPAHPTCPDPLPVRTLLVYAEGWPVCNPPRLTVYGKNQRFSVPASFRGKFRYVSD